MYRLQISESCINLEMDSAAPDSDLDAVSVSVVWTVSAFDEVDVVLVLVTSTSVSASTLGIVSGL